MNNTETVALRVFSDRLAKITDIEIAHFSGWLSADGSIKIDKDNGCPRIKFVITDRDPLEHFARLFGNSVGGPHAPSGLGKKPRYDWGIAGQKCKLLVNRCLPWLSVRYAEKAVRAQDYALAQKGRKINADIVADIKARLASGPHGIGRQLAKEYGVTSGLISAIKHGRTWV